MCEFNGNAVELIIAGKTQPSDQWSVIAEMRRRLLDRFEDDGIKLAIPTALTASKTKKVKNSTYKNHISR